MSAAAIDSSGNNPIYKNLSKPLLEFPKIFCILLGALLPFGFAPYGLYILSLVSVLGVIFIWRYQNPKTASMFGFIYRLDYLLVSCVYLLLYIFPILCYVRVKEAGRKKIVGRKTARFHRGHHVRRLTRARDIRN